MANEKKQTTHNSVSSAAGTGGANKSSKTSTEGASSENASAVEMVKSTAKDVLEKAKDSAGEAYGMVSEKAASAITEQKSNLSDGISGIADTIRQFGGSLRENGEQNPVTDIAAKYGDSLAEQVELVANYFDQKDLREIVRDVENFARRQPTVFVSAAFAIGLLTARFLKSSSAESSGGEGTKANRKRQQSSGKNKSDNQNNPGGQPALGAS